MLGQDKSFDLFQKLMLLALDDPNAICNICMKCLVALSKLNDDSTEDFEKVLNHMREEYADLPNLEGVIILSMLFGNIPNEDLDNLKEILKQVNDD